MNVQELKRGEGKGRENMWPLFIKFSGEPAESKAKISHEEVMIIGRRFKLQTF
jgi:hypothetical protein